MKVVAYIILLILILISLSLNVVILMGLLEARQATVEALDEALAALDGIENEKFETAFHVQETIPVNAEVPFQREWLVPVHMEVPISHDIHFQDTLQIPINTALIKLEIDVPVDTTIPVNLTVPVDLEVPFAIDETIPVNTDVEIDLTVPVAIEMAETPLPSYLDRLRITLEQVQQQLLESPSWLPSQ